MKIGLIDVDGHNYPNLPLMKLSAWHKSKGDRVSWYDPFDGLIEEYDKVYMSKVFSFTPDYEHPIYAKEIEKGGTGYCIELISGDHEPKVLQQDLERIYWLRDNGFAPYVMLYNKDGLPKGHELRKLQRWVNNRFVFWKVDRFEDYLRESEVAK